MRASQRAGSHGAAKLRATIPVFAERQVASLFNLKQVRCLSNLSLGLHGGGNKGRYGWSKRRWEVAMAQKTAAILSRSIVIPNPGRYDVR
jgi:hypothetical protein